MYQLKLKLKPLLGALWDTFQTTVYQNVHPVNKAFNTHPPHIIVLLSLISPPPPSPPHQKKSQNLKFKTPEILQSSLLF